MCDGGIKSEIQKYINKDYSRFHTPGHFGKGNGALECAYKWDLTELDGLESLYENKGAIAQTEKKLSGIYGTNTVISAGGSTLGVQTMLALGTQNSKKIIAARNSHISLVNTAALLDLEIVWAVCERDEKTGLALPIDAELIRKLLTENKLFKTVFVTSPDYYGIELDIEKIAKVCSDFGARLLVDSAHGSHYQFLEDKSMPISLGAAICTASLHKTLPALTGASILQFSDEFSASEVKRYMSVFGSTSPSYLIMLSIDELCDYIKVKAPQVNIYDNIKDACKKSSVIKLMASEKGFAQPKGSVDPLRIALGYFGIGYTKAQMSKELSRHKISPEFFDDDYIVFILGTDFGDRDYDRMRTFISEIKCKKTQRSAPFWHMNIPDQLTSIAKGVFAKTQTVPVSDCVGKTAGTVVSMCPPGVPILIPGEKISEGVQAALKNRGVLDINVL